MSIDVSGGGIGGGVISGASSFNPRISFYGGGTNTAAALGLRKPKTVEELEKEAEEILNEENKRKAEELARKQKAMSVSHNIAGISDFGDSFFAGQKAEDSALTQTLDTGYDAVSDAALKSGNPYAMAAGAGMKALGMVTDGLQQLGVGTDQRTTTDQILDSKWMALTPVGLMNSIGGLITKNKTEKLNFDEDILNKGGMQYNGTSNSIRMNAEDANKKVGLFSTMLGEKADLDNKILESQRQYNVMEGIIGTATDKKDMAQTMQGYWNIARQNEINGGWNYMTMTAKKGGRLKKRKQADLGLLFNLFEPLPEILDLEPQNEGNEAQTEAFRKGGKFVQDPDCVIETTQKNVIPEGELHAKRHNMENAEDLTKKGIPVVGFDGEQQAEIERNEIIFSLEVTKRLEELYKEGTDEAAEKAGKILVEQILFNTDDRTKLIKQCRDGGVLHAQLGTRIPDGFDTFDDFMEYIVSTGRFGNDDYDYNGFFGDKILIDKWISDERRNPGMAHFDDKYKLPTHMTFSLFSKYNSTPDGVIGGSWTHNLDGTWTFVVSDFLSDKHSLDDYIRYFEKNEPGNSFVYRGKAYYPPFKNRDEYVTSDDDDFDELVNPKKIVKSTTNRLKNGGLAKALVD